MKKTSEIIARATGLEPATTGSTVRYSNQLNSGTSGTRGSSLVQETTPPNRVKVRGQEHGNWKGNRVEIRSDVAVIFLRARNGKEAEGLVDSADLDAALSHSGSWYAWQGGTTTYVCANAQRPKHGRIYLHRFLLCPPKGLVVDHKNRNGLDNRRCNLRTVSQSVNCLNTVARAANRCGRRGVIWNERIRKWEARVDVAGKRIYLGCFDDLELASEAVRLKVAELLTAGESLFASRR
jgi:hypothetical protein